MSQWTYRAGSFVSAGDASGGDLVINRPTGTVDGDLIIIQVYFEPDTTTITIPTFTSAAAISNTGLFRAEQFWRIASGEPTTYTISNNTAGDQWRIAVAVAYSNGTGTGNRVDVSGGTQADGQTVQTAPSVTTNGVDRLLVFGYSNTGVNPSSLTGAVTTIRGSFGGTCIGDAARPTAGATGTTTINGTGTQDYAALHVAYISDLAAADGRRPMPIVVTQAASRAGGW